MATVAVAMTVVHGVYIVMVCDAVNDYLLWHVAVTLPSTLTSNLTSGMFQVPGLWELLGAAVVCSTTALLGWDEKRQHSAPQQQPQRVEEDSADEQDEDRQPARS